MIFTSHIRYRNVFLDVEAFSYDLEENNVENNECDQWQTSVGGWEVGVGGKRGGNYLIYDVFSRNAIKSLF